MLGLVLLPPGRSLPASDAPLEIELVQQDARAQGAPPQATAPEAPASQASAAASSSPPSPAAPAAKAAPAVNLGNADEDQEPYSVTGDNVVPPKPDARYRNLPPRYPAAASRVGAEGVVEVVAHVMPNGVPSSVTVLGSSGNAALDAEARRAVLLWRFTPALSAGRTVPFDYTLAIRFSLSDR